MSGMPKVFFREKSSFQKDDCINRSAEYDCPNKSTIEAVIGEGNVWATVRCCEDERCKAWAAETAQSSYFSLSGQTGKDKEEETQRVD